MRSARRRGWRRWRRWTPSRSRCALRAGRGRCSLLRLRCCRCRCARLAGPAPDAPDARASLCASRSPRAQLYTLDGLLTYLNKFAVAEEEAKPAAKAPAELPAGLKPLKKDDDLEGLFSVASKVRRGQQAGALPCMHLPCLAQPPRAPPRLLRGAPLPRAPPSRPVHAPRALHSRPRARARPRAPPRRRSPRARRSCCTPLRRSAPS